MPIHRLGSDPEFFIENYQGELRSIVGRLGGTKHKPAYIDEHGAFKMQEDNVAVEYNIPPADSRTKFIQYIAFGQDAISRILAVQDVRINRLASAIFPMSELASEAAQTFGCDPDYNAWSGEMNERPMDVDPRLRSAGGHIHIELTGDKSFEACRSAIRKMDKYLGIWTVIHDPDKQRRALYGAAGAFRPQPHGVEYRTPGNFWIFDQRLVGDVWDITQHALNQPDIATDSIEGMEIQRIINTSDVDAARSFGKELGIL